MPAGFRAEDYAGAPEPGFLPVRDAARRMRLSVDETVRYARAGCLDSRHGPNGLEVRPAVVSIVRVAERRE